MSDKQYLLVECYNQMWGIYDKEQSELDNPVLITYSKASVNFVVSQLNNKNEQIKELKKELKNRKKMNNILEGFLLDKGYDFNDILKSLQDRTEESEEE